MQRDMPVVHIQVHGDAGIGFAGSMAEQDNFGVEMLWREFEQSHSTEPQILVMRKRRTAAIEDHDALAVCQDVLMGVSRNHDLHRRGKELLQLHHRAETASQAMYHAETPAVDIQYFHVFTTRIRDRIVIAGGTHHGCKLL